MRRILSLLMLLTLGAVPAMAQAPTAGQVPVWTNATTIQGLTINSNAVEGNTGGGVASLGLPNCAPNALTYAFGTGFSCSSAGNVSSTGSPTTGQLPLWTNSTTVKGITVGTDNVVGNLGTGIIGIPLLSCQGGSNALNYTLGTGFSCLTITGSSAASITVGSTTIGSGTGNGVLYDNAGVLGNLASAANGVLVTSGAGVPSISTTLPNMAIGIPTSGTLTNATGLPVSTGISGFGSGIATALSVNTGSVGAPVIFGAAGGTPSSLTLTNATGLPPSGITAQSANTVLGSLTAVSPSGLAMPSCAGGSNALNWTSGSGFSCLTISGGSATSITIGTTTIGSGTTNGLLYDSAGVIGNLSTLSNAVLVTNGSGVPSVSTTLPNIAHGTPTSINLSNATNLPISTGVSGLGTGVGAALATSTGSNGSFVVVGAAGATGTAAQANGLNSATTTVVVNGATAPTTGQVLTATSGTAANWQTVSSSATTITPGTTTVSGATAPCLIDNSSSTVMGCAALGAGVTLASNTLYVNSPDRTSATAATVTAADMGGLINLTNAGTITQVLPAQSGLLWGAGSSLQVYSSGAGATTITNSSGLTLASTCPSSIPSGQLYQFSINTDGTPGARMDCAGFLTASGLGTGAWTALGVNAGSAGAFVVNGGALGTPSSGTATNLTGTAAGLTAGTATGANALYSATTTVNVSSATAPSVGQVLTSVDSTHATWQAVSASASSITPGTTTIVGGTAPCIITNSASTTMSCTNTPGAINLANGTNLPNASVNAATLGTGTTVSLAPPRQYYVCTGTCTVTPPVPAAGYEFCVMNDDNVATVITMAAIGTSARYENTARTAYGTASTGTFVSGGAVGDKVCLVGRDATHYLTVSFTGTWTAS